MPPSYSNLQFSSISKSNFTLQMDSTRKAQLQAFDDTKEGVKGLVDAKITEIPRIFHRPTKEINEISHTPNQSNFAFPVIDLQGIDTDSELRKQAVEKVLKASASIGFFQVINHGIPVEILEEMKQGVRRFYEQDSEIKKGYYTRELTDTVVYNSNFDLFSAPFTNWRDTVLFYLAPDPPNPEELPVACRDVLMEYSNRAMKLGVVLFELLSEALGLDPDHMKDIGCNEGLAVLCHYYPACPQPELTMGATQHADNDFLTVLLQDDIGGLQVLNQNQWIDVPPNPDALVINVGDLLQLISNDKFISSQHRVLSNHIGPRVSVASFFSTNARPTSRIYGPIKDLLSEDNPPKYRDTTIKEYTEHFAAKGLGTSALVDFRL